MNIGDSVSAHLVTCQMSHSATTEAQYYQAIVGDKHALFAYGTMTALRRDPKQMRELSERSESQGQRDTRNLSTASMSGEEGELTQLQKRRRFSSSETSLIANHNIKKKISVSLSDCKSFHTGILRVQMVVALQSRG